MRPRRFLPILLVATAAWLAAGPGGVTLQAITACWHHASPGAHGGHHEQPAPPAPMPPGAPCFCDQMTGGNDLMPTAALPSPAVVVGVVPAPVQEARFPLPASPSPDFVPAPIPPPPNPLA